VLADNPAIDDEAVCQLAASLQSDAAAAAAAAGCADEHTEQQQTQQQQNMKQQLVLDLAHAGVGADGVAALSKVAGLTQLSLFGCKLGGDPGESTLQLVITLSQAVAAWLLLLCCVYMCIPVLQPDIACCC
jgi:hypothetical protein